jgi:hypothetical protein
MSEYLHQALVPPFYEMWELLFLGEDGTGAFFASEAKGLMLYLRPVSEAAVLRVLKAISATFLGERALSRRFLRGKRISAVLPFSEVEVTSTGV